MGYQIELTNIAENDELAFRAEMSMRKAWKICDYINRHSHGVIKAEITKRKEEKK